MPNEDSSLNDRLQRLEWQVERIMLDIESDKNTGIRTGLEFSRKLDLIDSKVVFHDKVVWMATGALAILEICLKAFGK